MAQAVFELVVPEPSEPHESATLVHRLREWCQRQPNKRQYTWLGDTGNEEAYWSYRDLEMRADAVCHALQHLWGCRQGDRATLMYLPGLEFIAGFWGCLFAGVIAVPVYPVDLRGGKFEVGVKRFGLIVEACEAKLVLSHGAYLQLKRLHGLKNALTGTACWPEGLQFHATDELEPCDERHGAMPSPEQLAFLQFTSGSTGDPKGVILSHGNISHNTWMISRELGSRPEHVGVSWVPQYHDMGLIGVICQTQLVGAHTVLMSPITMLRNPLIWLNACSQYAAHQTCGMNGMYAHAVKRIPDQALKTLDLSSLCVYMSGGEPVRAKTVEAFASKFEACGLRRGACYPCLGIAENAVYVSGRGPELKVPTVLDLDKASLEHGIVAMRRKHLDDGQCSKLVSCGVPGPGVSVAIVDPDTTILRSSLVQEPLKAGLKDSCQNNTCVAEIWVSGPSKAQGYWGNPELSRETFRATIQDDHSSTEYLRTGDLGFIHEDELYVCGRLKDLIIVQGKNYYPQDIEQTVENSHSGLRPGCSAAFSVELRGEEMLVLMMEVKGKPSAEELTEMLAEARAAVSKDHQLQCHAVLLLKAKTIPRTTSGKIRRRASKECFLEWRQLRQSADTAHSSTTGVFVRIARMVNEAWSTPPAALDVLAHWICEVDFDRTSSLRRNDVSSQRSESDEKVQSSCSMDRELSGPPGLNINSCSIASSQVQIALKLLVEQQVGCAVQADDQLQGLGLTSTKAFLVIAELQEQLGVEVVSYAVFEHPTIRELAGHVATTIDAVTMVESILSPAPASKLCPRAPLASVAIVGQASRMASPLWPTIVSCACCITKEPPARWDAKGTAIRAGAFLADVDSFDADHFGLAPVDVAHLDPHALLALEVGAEAMRSAPTLGHTVAAFTAAIREDFSIPMATCNLPRLLASALGIQGPTDHFDKACTSSHMALHRAREAIQDQSCDAALVVGVTLMLQPSVSLQLLQQGVLSPSGICQPLDRAADGLVRGESCMALVLQAQVSGLGCLGVLHASAVTHNSLTLPSLLSPDQEAQEAAVRTAQAGHAVELLHLHGIGQLMADSTELLALKNAWPVNGTLLNHKANFGHTVGAAGVLAVVTTLEALAMRSAPAHLRLERPSMHLKRSLAPVQLTGMSAGLAAVHGHAVSGVNVHLVLEAGEATGGWAAVRRMVWEHAAGESSQLAALGEQQRLKDENSTVQSRHDVNASACGHPETSQIAAGTGATTDANLWHEGRSHADGGPNTLYMYSYSIHSLAPAVYAIEKGLVKPDGLKIHMLDLLSGEQHADWCEQRGWLG